MFRFRNTVKQWMKRKSSNMLSNCWRPSMKSWHWVTRKMSISLKFELTRKWTLMTNVSMMRWDRLDDACLCHSRSYSRCLLLNSVKSAKLRIAWSKERRNWTFANVPNAQVDRNRTEVPREYHRICTAVRPRTTSLMWHQHPSPIPARLHRTYQTKQERKIR